MAEEGEAAAAVGAGLAGVLRLAAGVDAAAAAVAGARDMKVELLVEPVVELLGGGLIIPELGGDIFAEERAGVALDGVDVGGEPPAA